MEDRSKSGDEIHRPYHTSEYRPEKALLHNNARAGSAPPNRPLRPEYASPRDGPEVPVKSLLDTGKNGLQTEKNSGPRGPGRDEKGRKNQAGSAAPKGRRAPRQIHVARHLRDHVRALPARPHRRYHSGRLRHHHLVHFLPAQPLPAHDPVQNSLDPGELLRLLVRDPPELGYPPFHLPPTAGGVLN